MRPFITLFIAAALCASASAETARISWQNATTNTDGSPVPATGPLSLSLTTVEYGTCGPNHTFGVKAGEMSVPAPDVTWIDVALVVVQEYCFRATHTNTSGVVSDPSNVVWKVNTSPGSPGPPLNLTVVPTDTTAYGVVITRDRVALVPVGTVAPGTMCDVTQRVLDKYVVPRIAVTFASGVQPQVVVATCG